MRAGISASAVSDVNGYYWFRLVRGGTFELRAYAEDASFTPATGITVAEGDDLSVNLTAGQSSLTVTVHDTQGTVEGG